MISQHFINPSPLGWIRISPDLQYVAIGGPGDPFRLYLDNGNLLLRATLPFEIEAADIAFRTVDNICTGFVLLTYDLEPKLMIVDLGELSTLPTVQIAGASSLSFSSDGTKLLVGIDNGMVLEYSQDDHGRFDIKEADYTRSYQLPSESRVTKVVAADAEGVIVAYNDDSQLFCVSPAETFELVGVDQNSSSYRLVRHHSSLPMLAALKYDGTLVIRNLVSGMLCEFNLVEPGKTIVSLSFAPNGDVVVATKTEVVLIAIFVDEDEAGEPLIRVQTTELYAYAKNICAAEVSELSDAEMRLMVLYH